MRQRVPYWGVSPLSRVVRARWMMCLKWVCTSRGVRKVVVQRETASSHTWSFMFSLACQAALAGGCLRLRALRMRVRCRTGVHVGVWELGGGRAFVTVAPSGWGECVEFKVANVASVDNSLLLVRTHLPKEGGDTLINSSAKILTRSMRGNIALRPFWSQALDALHELTHAYSDIPIEGRSAIPTDMGPQPFAVSANSNSVRPYPKQSVSVVGKMSHRLQPA
eukprot:scaffold14784_cov123-Isochrysis_galbana.AAC.1